MLDRSRVEVRTADGWRLVADLLEPAIGAAAGTSRSVAVLGHAMMADRRTMDRPRGSGLASTLAAGGHVVLNFDLRGHGESGPSARDGARYTYDDFVRFDVPAMIAEARTRFPQSHVTVVGHSLTAHASLFAAGLDPAHAPDAIVAIGVNVWLPRLDPSLARRALKAAILLGWAGLTRPRGYFDARRARVGTDPEPWPYVRQFVTSYLRDRFVSADGSIDYLDALARVTIPVLGISSEGDTLLAHPVAVARFLSKLERVTPTHRVVARDASGRAPGHMDLVVSAASQPVWLEIARWISASAGS